MNFSENLRIKDGLSLYHTKNSYLKGNWWLDTSPISIEFNKSLLVLDQVYTMLILKQRENFSKVWNNLFSINVPIGRTNMIKVGRDPIPKITINETINYIRIQFYVSIGNAAVIAIVRIIEREIEKDQIAGKVWDQTALVVKDPLIV